MVVEVIKGPEAIPQDPNKPEVVVKPDRIVEINAAMKERLRSAVGELKEQRSELAPFNARAASLTAQVTLSHPIIFGVPSDPFQRRLS